MTVGLLSRGRPGLSSRRRPARDAGPRPAPDSHSSPALCRRHPVRRFPESRGHTISRGRASRPDEAVMRETPHARLVGYGVAILATGLSLLLPWPLEPWLRYHRPPLRRLPAPLPGGWAPGLGAPPPARGGGGFLPPPAALLVRDRRTRSVLLLGAVRARWLRHQRANRVPAPFPAPHRGQRAPLRGHTRE